ncbi:MAG TPA: NADH-quinone oxidoreductase subunit J [Vicinamibacterales bacterium]|jgi:NADH-quinone oxidoreductase subunit J
MGEAIAFYTLAAMILAFGVLVITAKSTVHSIMFLIANFLFIAGLYAMLNAPFLAAIQVIVYAGGIVVLYLFVVMLVNLKRPPEAHQDKRRRSGWGVAFSVVVLAELIVIAAYKLVSPASLVLPAAPMGSHNVEAVGWLLYTDYLVPFEVASMLLLVAMVGAIVLARREL